MECLSYTSATRDARRDLAGKLRLITNPHSAGASVQPSATRRAHPDGCAASEVRHVGAPVMLRTASSFA